MRPQTLAPGRLARLISALYEATSGPHAAALHHAAASSKLQVLVSTQCVPQHMNRYNISAALLAPTWAGNLSLEDWAKDLLSTSSSSSSSAARLHPTAAALSLSQQNAAAHHTGWGALGAEEHCTCRGDRADMCGTVNLPAADMPAEDMMLGGNLQNVSSSNSHCNRHSPGLTGNHRGPLFPVYLVIAGISGGLDQHVQAARQLYSQADFFVCAQPGSFWNRVAQALDHGLAVPDLLQQPLDGFIVPWLRVLYNGVMPRLTQQGYAGFQVILSGHSLGGFLADSAALMLPHNFPHESIQFSCVTFDSPGVPAAVMRQYGAVVDSSMQRLMAQRASINDAFQMILGTELQEQQQSLSPGEVTAITHQSLPDNAAAAAAAAAPDSRAATAAATRWPRAATASAAAAVDPSHRMVSYLASPTPLNTLFRHPGLLYHIKVDSHQGSTAFDVVAYTVIDAARCCFMYDVFHLLFSLEAVAPSSTCCDSKPAGALSAAADATPPDSCGAAAAHAAGIAAVAAAASTFDLLPELPAAAAGLLPASAVLAGVFGSLAGRLGLGAVDLVGQHSLDGMRCRAFDPQSGEHYAAKVQQMHSWPMFSAGSELKAVVLDLLMGLLPSVVWRNNRGLWTWWEGKAARSKRVLTHQQGFVPSAESNGSACH